MTSGQALQLIVAERERQDKLRREGKFLWTCADPRANHEKLAVLAEEFGEVAREVTEEIIAHDKGRSNAEIRIKLRKELVQVGAVVLAWLESLS